MPEKVIKLEGTLNTEGSKTETTAWVIRGHIVS